MKFIKAETVVVLELTEIGTDVMFIMQDDARKCYSHAIPYAV
jgi:hypothetical protein